MIDSSKPIVVAITGASGVAYGVRLLEVLLESGREVHLTVSPSGQAVLQHELNLAVDLDRFKLGQLGIPTRETYRLAYHHPKNLMAPIASGSFLTAGMVICPCSGSTLGAVVHSVGDNLIHRAAECHLKEQRKLIVVPRETPLSLPQLRNMQLAAEAGAVILPASPGFYHGAEKVSDLIDFVVARICDQLGVEHQLMRRWGSGA
jgi:4-hydroxy-3-polyprenylbenzoate decarboxylase